MAKTTVHKLKLCSTHCDVVHEGIKSFDVRRNDRQFQKGDRIQYVPYDLRDEVSDAPMRILHPITDELFEITFVVSGNGVSPEFVVLGIRKLNL